MPFTFTDDVDATLYSVGSIFNEFESVIAPPFRLILKPTDIPLGAESPVCTVYLNTREDVPLPDN